MIKIDPKSFEHQVKTGNIHDVYTEKRYSNNPKLSLIDVVAARISVELKKPNHSSSDEIVDQFLRKHFTDALGNVVTQNVADYLIQTDLKSIILSFWECVTRVWIKKLQNDALADPTINLPFPTLDPNHPKDQSQRQLITDIALHLGKWNGVRERALKTKQVPDRVFIVREALTDLTLPFFNEIKKDELDPNRTRNTAISNLNRLRDVRFRYHTDLYSNRNLQSSKGNSSSSTHKNVVDILSYIFDYDLLDGNPRHKLLSSIYAPVCPYCNRQYITIFQESKDNKTTADLDHFYIKSIYPYLALSLYNFVPSCQICNSRFKGDRDFYGSPHLYPYTQESNSRLKFSITNPKILMYLQDQSSASTLRKTMAELDMERVVSPKHIISVTPAKETDVEADNSRKTFRLEEVYQSHKDYVYELLLKIHAYNDSKIHDLYLEFPDLFSSEEEVRSLVFGQYLDSEEMIKRPLAKLTQDLLAISKKGKL